jgi:hypothetical protein
MFAAMATTIRMATAAVVAVAATKKMAATTVVRVVAQPHCFVRLACRGAPKKGLQWQSGDCWKGLFKPNQIIAFN